MCIRAKPDLALDRAILLLCLLLDPVDTSMRAVFLSFGVTHFPEVDEWWSLLEHHRVLTVLIVLLTINTLILKTIQLITVKGCLFYTSDAADVLSLLLSSAL